MTELGIDDPSLLRSPQEYSQEDRLRIESYKEAIAGILQELVDSGMPVLEAVEARTRQITNLKNEYNINKQEHFQVLSGLFDALRPKAEKLLALLQTENSRYQVISNFQPRSNSSVFVLLQKLLLAKQQLILRPLLAVLELLNDEPDAMQLAKRTGVVASDAIALIVATEPQWQQRLNSNLYREIIPKGGRNNTQATVIKDGGTQTRLRSRSLSDRAVGNALLELLQEPNPITESASLYALAQLNREKGIAQAQKILQQPLQNDLVKNTAASILGQSLNTSVIEQLLSMSAKPYFQTMTPEQLLALLNQAQQNHQDITEIAPPSK